MVKASSSVRQVAGDRSGARRHYNDLPRHRVIVGSAYFTIRADKSYGIESGVINRMEESTRFLGSRVVAVLVTGDSSQRAE
jgi:hypothetical protein